MTTPQQRVRALVKAIADLRRGDLEAVLDLDRFAKHYPEYAFWYDLRMDDPDFIPDEIDDEGNYSVGPEHLRFLASADALRGISGHVLGRLWEFHLGDIMQAGAYFNRHPSGPTPIRAVPLRTFE